VNSVDRHVSVVGRRSIRDAVPKIVVKTLARDFSIRSVSEPITIGVRELPNLSKL